MQNDEDIVQPNGSAIAFGDSHGTGLDTPSGRADMPVWHRIGLLFGLLCLIKVAMLLTQGKYLFQTHWRVEREIPDWINTAAFYGFALLVGCNLWALGSRCLSFGVKAVRGANVLVLILAALFIFLTFHEGDKNYLHPVMMGILGWTDLGPYMELNFFFRPPFLAAWLFLYVAVYYTLIRTRREKYILRATAIFGTVYTIFCLHDLERYRTALVIVDCLGVACLFGASSGRPLSARWQILVPVGAASLFLLFRQFETNIAEPNPFFQTVAGSVVIVVGGVGFLAWRRGIYSAWSWLLPFMFGAILLLCSGNYPMSGNYQNLLSLGLTLPRYFLGEVAIAAVLLVLASVYRRWRPAGTLWWLDLICLAVLVTALLDLQLSRIMGVRLDWEVLAFADSPKMMWRMARPYLLTVIGMLGLLAGCYGAGLYWLGRRQSRGTRRLPLMGWRVVGPVFVGFVLLGMAGKWLARPDRVEGQTLELLARTSPLWKTRSVQAMDRNTFRETAQQLGIEFQRESPVEAPVRSSRKMNVVLIFQESTYNKYLSLFGSAEETQPLLSKYKDRMELFPRYFTSFAGSIHARFAAFTGLYPVKDFQTFTGNRVAVKSLFEILSENDYSCSLFYSSFFDYTSFRDFLRGRRLNEMYDADTMPGERILPPLSWGLREEETLAAIQDRIRGYASEKRPFFLTYIPAAPHYPYDGVPERFRKHRPDKIGDYRPFYLNELLYMDWVVTSIVDELKATGMLDNTLVVITGDHGKMLGGDDGAIGHGWAVTPELANVPLIIMNPERPGYHVNETVGSHVDLLPTILDILNVPVGANELYEGDSLYSAAATRAIYLSSMLQYGVIKNGVLYIGSRDADSAKTSSGFQQAYILKQNGAQPLFLETNLTDCPKIAISEFDRFQEEFLRDYSRFSEAAELRHLTLR